MEVESPQQREDLKRTAGKVIAEKENVVLHHQKKCGENTVNKKSVPNETPFPITITNH